MVNAANEVAVAAFLDGKISFNQISEIVAYSLQTCKPERADSCEVIEEVDRRVRGSILNHF
jgi:1-deoxy-D-xylulose-5-phosphate reductoisomerase